MAIIVVLAAVAIPTFGRQLETARETGDLELIRAAYNDALAIAVLDASDGKLDGKNVDYNFATATLTNMKVKAPTTGDNGTGLQVQVKIDDCKQVEKGFQYVNGYIAGVKVGDTDHPVVGDNYVTFEFKLETDGSVKLDNATGKLVTVNTTVLT